MKIPTDWREFIELLNSRGVEYLIVGAHAVAYHGRPRTTGDLDIFVRCTPANAARLEDVIRTFGFASLGLTATDFEVPDQIVQLGVAPNRLDVITSLSGVSFSDAWNSRVAGELDGVPVSFIGRELLIQNKRASGRSQDLTDADSLEKE